TWADGPERFHEATIVSSHATATKCLTMVACGIAFATLGCTSSPAAPSPISQPQPLSPFANIAGDYTLIITMDEKCTQIPEPLRVRTYDVVLDGNSPGRFSPGYIDVAIVGNRFGGLGGELWAPRSDSRYRFEWNNFDVGGCDYPDPSTSPPLY